jgi:hypothetical protein
VIEYQPHRTLAHLRGKLVRRFAHHGSILLGSWSLRQTRGGSDLIAHGSLVVRDVFSEFVRAYVPADALERDIELFIVGWSERDDRPRAYRLYSDGLAFAADAQPFVFQSFDNDETWDIAPAFQSLEPWQRLGRQGIELDENGYTTEQFDPIKHGLAYMQEQRHIRVDIGSNSQISIVGGFLLSHEITRDGVSERVTHRWNDKIGEPIHPEEHPAFENVTPLKMNRHDRRAAAKQSVYARA